MSFQFLGIGNGPDTSQYQLKDPNLNNFQNNPYISALQKTIGQMQAPGQVNPTSVSAIDMSKADLPQYDAMRSRLNTQYSQQQQQSQDAIDRQFAAMGGGPGNGAQIKQTENLNTDIAKQKGSDLEGINAQEAATRTGLQEQNVQNQLQAGEFNSGQDLSAKEFNTQANQGYQQFQFGAGAQVAGLNTQWDQAQAEANNNEFNKALSDWQATHSGGLLGGGGLLGLGIG